jgi:hypothetical protein
MRQLRDVLNAHRQNFRMTQFPVTVLDPLNEAPTIVAAFEAQLATIGANPHLTADGKAAERAKAAQDALDKIQKWHTPRLAGLDADLGKHRAALLVPATAKPDARRVDFLLSHLRALSPVEIATFYGSATDDERRLMEAAAESVGRVPMKTENGLEWRPLLDSETVTASIADRAAVRDPAGAARLEELVEIRAMHVTVAAVAAAEVRELLGG